MSRKQVKAKEIFHISEHSGIFAGEDGKYYQIFPERPVMPETSKNGGPRCQSLCGRAMRRPHWTCLFCRIRRVAMGELPQVLEVGVYMLTIRKGRSHWRIKNILIRRLMNVAEFLAA
jgi:hypothetical protein